MPGEVPNNTSKGKEIKRVSNLFRRPPIALVLVEAALQEVGKIRRQLLRDENVVDDLALGQGQGHDAQPINVDLFAAPENRSKDKIGQLKLKVTLNFVKWNCHKNCHED